MEIKNIRQLKSDLLFDVFKTRPSDPDVTTVCWGCFLHDQGCTRCIYSVGQIIGASINLVSPKVRLVSMDSRINCGIKSEILWRK